MKRVIGLGNALTDILVNLKSEEVLEKFSLHRGGMCLMDTARQHELSQALAGLPQGLSLGGSTSNTIRALAHLGIETGYIGKVGRDATGDFFEETLRALGIESDLFRGEQDSGRCISLISADGERTMCTYLGAALELRSEEIRPEILGKYDYFYIEGFQVQNHALIRHAAQTARAAGLQVALDLASYNVVEENLDFLHDFTGEYVDILFANEQEAAAFTGEHNPLEALDRIAHKVRIGVVKAGATGSYIKYRGKVDHVGVLATSKLADTTGAGDFYAAGFLYGLCKGLSMLQCGTIGAILGGKVVETVGTTMTPHQWEEVEAYIRNAEQGLYIF